MPKGGLRSTSWNKGESGNITGRPKRPEAIEAKKIVADVKAAAREHTQDALDTLKAVMSDAKAPPAARVSAATAMLDRGWGRAKETVDANVGVSLEALILASLRPTGQSVSERPPSQGPTGSLSTSVLFRANSTAAASSGRGAGHGPPSKRCLRIAATTAIARAVIRR